MPLSLQSSNFTRTTGATRVNEFGVLVGVDFSSTSNTIGTGTRTFVLTAALNSNRFWRVGESVLVTAQAGATGTMTGLVSSYVASTQTLVIEVASITGSGTSTNWRIGSLESRVNYDPVSLKKLGLMLEQTRTNLLFPSQLPTAAQTVAVTTGLDYTVSFFGTGTVVLSGATALTLTGNGAFGSAPLSVRTFRATTNSLTLTPSGLITDWQLEQGTGATSRIPTTTIAVARNQDVLAVTGDDFTSIAQNTTGTFVGTFNNSVTYNQVNGATTRSVTGNRTQRLLASFSDTTEANSIKLIRRASGVTTGQTPVDMVCGSTLDVGIIGLTLADTGNNGNVFVSDGAETRTVSTSGRLATEVPSAIASLGSEYVIVGANGSVTSFDGVSAFSNIGPNNGTYNRSATFTGNKFLAFNGNSTITYSDDGTSWFYVQNSNANEIRGFASNGTNVYVAVGLAGSISTSTDASSWTNRTSGVATTFNDVAFGVNRFVAVNATAANSRYSNDGGITWLAVSGLTGDMRSIIFTGTLFIAVNAVGGIFQSTDGITFTAVTTTGITGFTDVRRLSFGADYYVFVGNGGQVAVSNTAATVAPATWITYTNATTPSTGTTAQWDCITFIGGSFYLGSDAGTRITRYTPANNTFTLIRSGVNVFGIAASSSIIAYFRGVGRFHAGTVAQLATVDEAALNGADELYGIAFGNGVSLIVGDLGRAVTLNPTTKAIRRVQTGLTTNPFTSVQYVSDRFLIGGRSTIYNTIDGITWASNGVSGQPANTYWNDFAYNGSRYLTVSSSITGTVGWLATGTTVGGAAWTAYQIAGFTPVSVCYALGVYVAVGSDGQVWTSLDPVNAAAWTQVFTSGAVFNKVVYSERDACFYLLAASLIRKATYENGVFAVTALDLDIVLANYNAGVLTSKAVVGQANSTTDNKYAFTWRADGTMLASMNGNTPVTLLPTTVPTLTSFGLNALANRTSHELRSLKLYKSAASSSEIQALSRRDQRDNAVVQTSNVVLGTGVTLEQLLARYGTTVFQNIGTSGATVPLLNGVNTWSGNQSIIGASLRVQSVAGAADPGTGQVLVRGLQTTQQTISTTGNIPALTSDTYVIRLAGAAPVVQGISAPTSGSRLLRIWCANSTTFNNADAAAATTNQILISNAANRTVAANTFVDLFYDTEAARWRLNAT